MEAATLTFKMRYMGACPGHYGIIIVYIHVHVHVHMNNNIYM